MEHIILVGDQNSGKTFFANILAKQFKNVLFTTNSNLGKIDPKIDCIVIDELSYKRDMKNINEIISKDFFTSRVPYTENVVERSNPFIIAIFQELPLGEWNSIKRPNVFKISRNV